MCIFKLWRVALFAPAVFIACPQQVLGWELGDKPPAMVGPIAVTHYDGTSNDLLTAGLGQSGLGSAVAPSLSSPPTIEELRRLAIWTNYRALVDPTPGGGYGTLYGPASTATGPVGNPQGLIPGTEILALTFVPSRDAAVPEAVTIMVQIPDRFDPAKGCIVAAPSSGSRGVYGAIATAGEWGLKHGCAVAYTDKGTGTGAHDLHNDTVNLFRGDRAPAPLAGPRSNFTAPISESERLAFDAAYPNRFAVKHAHSEANPESEWGTYVLQAIEAAFFALNATLSPGDPHAINRRNTVVIASSVSNGGGASLRAAEQDRDHLIDGVAVAEPNVQPVRLRPNSFGIQQGDSAPFYGHSKSLEDYITFENLYAGCAAVAQGTAAPLNLAASPGRCDALAATGLLAPGTPSSEAAEAQQKINAFGILPEQNFVAPSHWYAYVHQSISVTYTNAYGEFSVLDDLCGISMGATDATGAPIPLASAAENALFGLSNGIPPSAGINLINDRAPSGPREDRVSTPDQDLRGALCLRSLARGNDASGGAAPDAAIAGQAARVARGVRDVLASGDLHGIPAVYVVGRNDGILPPNFAGRAYYGLNQTVEGERSGLHYYEVTNAQHLDSFNQYAGFDSTLVPLHRYFVQAMDLMYAHLTTGASLPPSQVVHTTPRGPGAPAITLANVPPLAETPDQASLITFSDGLLRIPD
ncbi:MAG: D-(-)-3-hydroxybutyrate oligomer hydrolase [Acetobacteraceae bacterium]|nr:D-(-)-3-hydroxybutyrate oligomer hydrolase [Acetobacteraceae bacterium]